MRGKEEGRPRKEWQYIEEIVRDRGIELNTVKKKGQDREQCTKWINGLTPNVTREGEEVEEE